MLIHTGNVLLLFLLKSEIKEKERKVLLKVSLADFFGFFFFWCVCEKKSICVLFSVNLNWYFGLLHDPKGSCGFIFFFFLSSFLSLPFASMAFYLGLCRPLSCRLNLWTKTKKIQFFSITHPKSLKLGSSYSSGFFSLSGLASTSRNFSFTFLFWVLIVLDRLAK